jgi:hypothetical protein
MQCACVNLLHEPDIFVAVPERLQPESMAEANVREVLMAEQNCHTLTGAVPVKGHFCVSHVIDEPPRRQWWQHSPGLCTLRTAWMVVSSSPVHPPMVKDLASLRVSLLR